METVVISAATDGELSDLIRRYGAQQLSSRLPMDLHAIKTSQGRILLARTGIGKALAASAATALIHSFSPDLIINTGCAGAYAGRGLAVGDLALASCEIFADDGVETADGWQSLEQLGLFLWEKNGLRHGNEIPLSSSLVGKALRVADRQGLPLQPGRFLTVSTCSGSRMRGEALVQRYGAVCENMEGAAVALVAALYGINCMEVRGISNMVEDRDLSRWDIPLAIASVSSFIERFLESV
jgi:futalosine hydrolase